MKKNNDNRHSNDSSPNPRSRLHSEYKNHKLEFLVSKYVETKYVNSIKKTTEQLFESVKEFIPNQMVFLKEIDEKYKEYEREYEEYNKDNKRIKRYN